MNKLFRFPASLILISILFILLISGCANSSDNGERFVIGGTFRLNESESINGDLSVFGGAVTLEEGSTVNGNLILIGGSVNAAGTINGNIDGLGGSINLTDTAVVQGDISTVGASVNKSDKAEIQGKIISQSEGGVNVPNLPRYIVPSFFRSIAGLLGNLLFGLILGVLAVLVMLFLPRQTTRIGQAIVDSPLTTGAIGLLTLMLFPFVIFLLILTVCLIPIGFAGLIVLIFGMLFGWIAIGLETGNRIAALLKVNWAPAVSAGIGTFMITLLAALFSIIDCVGWVIPTIVVLLATGGVVITIFGTRGINSRSYGQRLTPPSQPTPTSPPASPPTNVIIDSAPITNPEDELNPDSDPATQKEQPTTTGIVTKQQPSKEPEIENKPKPRTRKSKPATKPPEEN